MQKAIELNDNRAVYRSRQLLDSDLAARSASLARIYSDLGFQQLALGRRLEIGQHRSDELLSPPIPRRFLLDSAAPRDRQSERTASVSAASAAQHHTHPAASSRKQFVSDQRRQVPQRLSLQRVQSLVQPQWDQLPDDRPCGGKSHIFGRRSPLRDLQKGFLQPRRISLSDRRLARERGSKRHDRERFFTTRTFTEDKCSNRVQI